MKININRTEKKIEIASDKDCFAGSILERHGYK